MPTSTTNCNTTRATIRRRIAKPPSGSADGSIDAGAATLQPPRVSGALLCTRSRAIRNTGRKYQRPNRRAQRHARETAIRCVQNRRGSRAVADDRRTSPPSRMGPAAGLVLFLAALWLPFGWPLGPASATAAGNCKLALDAGGAAPGSGTPSTVVDFTVVVSYKAACSARKTYGSRSPDLGHRRSRSRRGRRHGRRYHDSHVHGAAQDRHGRDVAVRVRRRLTAAGPWVVLPGTAPDDDQDQRPADPQTDAQTHPEAKADPQTHARRRPPSRPRRRRPGRRRSPTRPPRRPRSDPQAAADLAPETTSDPKETPDVTTPPAIVEPARRRHRPPAIGA